MEKIYLSTGQTVAYDTYGRSTATPVVLLHGLSSNRHVYDHLVVDLADELENGELQLFNIDLRGHGESSHATLDTYDAYSYAADIADFIKQKTDRPAIVIAESLGGVIGMALAQQYPDLTRGLFLEDPPLFLGEAERLKANDISKEFPEMIEMTKDMQGRNAPVAEYDEIMRDNSVTDDTDELTQYVKGLPDWDTESMQAALDGILWRGFDPLAKVDCPLVILRADPAMGAAFSEEDVEPLQKAHPKAKIEMIEGATHSMRATRHAAWLGELRTFIANNQLIENI